MDAEITGAVARALLHDDRHQAHRLGLSHRRRVGTTLVERRLRARVFLFLFFLCCCCFRLILDNGRGLLFWLDLDFDFFTVWHGIPLMCHLDGVGLLPAL